MMIIKINHVYVPKISLRNIYNNFERCCRIVCWKR